MTVILAFRRAAFACTPRFVSRSGLFCCGKEMDRNKSDHAFTWLRHLAPEFAVNGANIEVLYTPESFHSKLMKEAKNAKKRIVLAALYLGTGSLEKDLLLAVQEAVSNSCNRIEVDILLDYVRGSRGEKNSRTMLQPLIEQCEESKNLRVALYHTPNLRGVAKKYLPPRWNEIVGVAHLKVFIFDDNLVISGANLSHDYFVNRQDRYMVFHNCPQLADYFHDIVNTVRRFSLQLLPNGNEKLMAGWGHHPFNGNFESFSKEAYKDVESLIQSSLSSEAKEDTKINDGSLQKTADARFLQRILVYSTSIIRSIVPTWAFSLMGVQIPLSSEAGNLVKSTISNKLLIKESDAKAQNVDTWVYPTIQMGLFGIRQDEIVTESLMKSFPKGSHVAFTTGYFNVTDKYCTTMVKNKASYSILLSSPEANGFFGSQGFGGYIPAVYIHLCRKFYQKVVSASRTEEFTLLEYIRNGWTFHGKGLWCYLPGEKLPSMSVVGSPNFGLRSVNRDLEAQVVLVTKNEELRRKLHDEKENLTKYTERITQETFEQPRYQVPRWVALATFFIKRFF